MLIETYKKIMSKKPEFDQTYITDILQLKEEERILNIETGKVTETDTAFVTKLIITIESPKGDYEKKLFVKTSKPYIEGENSYQEMSLRECSFYQLIQQFQIQGIPMPRCYDAYLDEKEHEFVLVLEDVSEEYHAPNEKDLADLNVWYSCAESLAAFHAACWNHELIGKNKFLTKKQSDIEKDIESSQKDFNVFLEKYKDTLDERTIEVLKHSKELNNYLMRKRTAENGKTKNTTICNGDSHVYNFLIANEISEPSIIVDYQFWHDGYGTSDVAHLTRISFPQEFKENHQIDLLKRYYETLLKCGVTTYSWEECYQDYRLDLAAMALIPVWQASYFGVPFEEWHADIKGLVDNYDIMECDEIYKQIIQTY